jgi:hypothetical protein
VQGKTAMTMTASAEDYRLRLGTSHSGSSVQPMSLSQIFHSVKSREGKNSAKDSFGLAMQNFWKGRVHYVPTLLMVGLLQIILTE